MVPEITISGFFAALEAASIAGWKTSPFSRMDMGEQST